MIILIAINIFLVSVYFITILDGYDSINKMHVDCLMIREMNNDHPLDLDRFGDWFTDVPHGGARLCRFEWRM